MACEEPFILSKRKDSPYYQVRFKNPDKNSTIRFLPAKSTKETVKSKALRISQKKEEWENIRE